MKVVTFGELMVRLQPFNYERFVQANSLEFTFGGGEANVAVSLANYGLDAAFVTKLPAHAIGQAAVNSLRRYGVDTSMITRGGDRVGIYYNEKGASQRGSVCIYDRANSAIQLAQPSDFDWDKIFEGVDWFHFTGITPALGANVVEIMTVVCLLFKFVYNPQMGLLNSFLQAVGLDNLTKIWLGSKKTAMYAVIAVSQWQSTGYVTMLFIVAIQKIPKDLYEAAEVDGAGKIKKFFYITVPQVKQMFFVTMILTVVGAFTVFNEPYILTGGGPGTATMVLSLHMYQTGFIKNNMGYASAIAMLIFVITAVLSSVQFFSYGTEKEGR